MLKLAAGKSRLHLSSVSRLALTYPAVVLALALPLLVLVLGLFAPLRDLAFPPPLRFDLEVFLDVPDDAGSIKVYLNADWARPRRVEVVSPGSRRYVFSDVPGHLQLIRIDPVHPAGSVFRLGAIAAVARGGYAGADGAQLARIDVGDGSQWSLARARWDDKVRAFVATADDPTFTRPLDIDLAALATPPPLAPVGAGIALVALILAGLAALAAAALATPALLRQIAGQPQQFVVGSCLATVALVGGALQYEIWQSHFVPRFEARADLEATPQFAAPKLYVNDDWNIPRLAGPDRQADAFIFDNLPTRLNSLRLDPPITKGGMLSVKSLRFVTSSRYWPAPGQDLAAYTAAQIAGWAVTDLRPIGPAGSFVATGMGPTLRAAPKLDFAALLPAGPRRPIGLRLAGAGLAIAAIWDALVMIWAAWTAFHIWPASRSVAAIVGLGVLGWILTVASSFPGHWDYDQYYALNELLGHDVTDLQPPLSGLAWLATIRLAAFFGGSALAQLSLLLLVQATIFWAGAVLFAFEFRHRWIGCLLMMALLLLTPLLVYSGNIGKDGQLMVAMSLAVLATHIAARRRAYIPLALAVLPLFYAFAVRSNGPLAVMPLCYYWSWALVQTVLDRRAARRGLAAGKVLTNWRPRPASAIAGTALFAMLLAATFGLMSAVVTRPCCLGTPGTLTFVHDLMGMSVRVGKVLVPPYIIATPSYSVADIERAYYPPDNVNFNGLVSILPPATQRRVIGDWLVAVRTYPLAYLEHRLDVLGYFLGVTRMPNRYALFIGSNAGEYSWVVDSSRRLVGGMKDIPPQFDAIKGRLFAYFFLVQDTLLFRAFAYMAVFVAAFVYLRPRRRGVLSLTADFAGLSAAIYFVSHFVLTSSASFRYIVWPILAVPIVVFCLLDETMTASDEWAKRPLLRRPPIQFVALAVSLIGAIEVLRQTFG